MLYKKERKKDFNFDFIVKENLCGIYFILLTENGSEWKKG